MSRIVLASSSPRRHDLLARAGIRFFVVAPESEMTPPPGMSADIAVQVVARQKAQAVAKTQAAGTFVLAADTMVVGPRGPLGKPLTAERALSYLRELRGCRHTVLTGICVMVAGGDAEALAVSKSAVKMRDYPESLLEQYIATGEPLDRAGGYAIQGGGGDLVEAVAGRVDTVVGLDVPMALRLLAEVGYPDPLPAAIDISLAPPRSARRPLTPLRAAQRA